uniref:Uncharacterized protein n=1 Tax=Glossina pallidipes TaxID=7398 RepID=A0A1A9ZLE6_GLOPL
MLTTTNSQQHDLIISIKFHNDYARLLNTVAYMLRFIYNCKFKAKRKYGSLDATELDASRLKIIKYIQIIPFHDEIAAAQKGANLNAKDSPSHKQATCNNITIAERHPLKVGTVLMIHFS